MSEISIITPVYNVEKYLKKSIDSILNQTFKDFELIIVDDGSKDSCGEIIDSYKKIDDRVRVIHKENGGAPSARNAGIEIATGKYMYFPDSDDWLEPDYLQNLYDAMCKTNAQVVISGYTMEYYENNASQTYKVSVEEANYDSKELLRNNLHKYFDNMMVAVPWNKLYSSEYIKSNNLRFPMMKWDDLHFNMDVIMDIDRVAICNSAGYHFFRSRYGSETTIVFDGMLYQKRREQFLHIMKVYEHWNMLDNNDIMSYIYGYYAARLVQCIQEISISKNDNKRKLISDILNDNISFTAIKKGKIKSGLLSIAAFPMKKRNISLCILVGKMMGFVKVHMSAFFYKLKSKSVNKAVVVEK